MDIKELIDKGFLGDVFRQLRGKLEHDSALFAGTGFMDRLAECETEFRFMSDFMFNGYQDPHRDAVYRALREKIMYLVYDLRVHEDVRNLSYLQPYCKTHKSFDNSMEAVQGRLCADATQAEHYNVLSDAFMELLVSYHWTNLQTEEWQAFLLSRKTDVNDACTLVSAIGLSAYAVFSYEKALCLANIYRNSECEQLRQRAFVGVMLALCQNEKEADEATEKLMGIMASAESFSKDIMEMQMQMTSCANVDKDTKEIRSRIMPGILRNQPFDITPDGIKEKEDDDDCIDTGASERKMEEMEKSVKQMLEMQKNGADIFFDGFRQMKRYPFFYKMANWFMPFSLEHPDIQTYMSKMQTNSFLRKVMEQGPFCNSDKYSFVMAFSSVVDKLPENVRSMMDSGEVGVLGMRPEGERIDEPSFLRLQYLQDLYRYYRLNPLASSKVTPFDHAAKYLPWKVARKHLDDETLSQMCHYITWKNPSSFLPDYVNQLAEEFTDKDSFAYYRTMSDMFMRSEDYSSAIEYGLRCLKIKSNHAPLMRNIAKAYYACGDYSKAAFYFDALATLYPDRYSYTLNYAMSMTMDGAAQMVVNDLYKLDFEHPDNVSIQNTLGWVLLHAQKPEKALAVYEKMNGKESAEDSVTINTALAMIVNGKTMAAVDVLKKFGQDVLLQAFDNEKDMLRIYGIGEAEMAIILSKVTEP